MTTIYVVVIIFAFVGFSMWRPGMKLKALIPLSLSVAILYQNVTGFKAGLDWTATFLQKILGNNDLISVAGALLGLVIVVYGIGVMIGRSGRSLY